MVSVYKKILGHPFVYERIRPRVVGGIDYTAFYELLDRESRTAIVDVGCGTGDALRYLDGCESYLGVDTDPVAIEVAKKRAANRPGFRFECRTLEAKDIHALAPTAVVLTGVIHHLSNEDAESVLAMAAASPRLRLVATLDIVFIPGRFYNNLLAMMDRGRFCRVPDAYADLARRAGFDVARAFTMPSAPGNEKVYYHGMVLEKRRGS